MLASDETIRLPVPSKLAPKLAAEVYMRADDRPVRLLEFGHVEIGHFRLLSLATETHPGGYPILVATYQRVWP